MAFIETQNLTFSYPAEDGQLAEPVLQEVSLAIPEGQFVALLGHNGCGKSTLAKQFNAMLLPSGGAAYVDGMTTADEALTFEIRRRVGLVLQNPDNQLVASVVEEDVAFGPENLGVPHKEIRRRSTPLICSPADRSSGLPLRESSLWSLAVLCWTSLPPCWIHKDGRR